MNRYALSHLADAALRRDLAGLVARDRATTAELLAHLAEFDARKLYLPEAHPSMYAYCVGELGFSEDAACKRIRAARTARQFPAIFEMLADGRLNLTTVVTLAPFMTHANAGDLLAAATRRSKAEVERLLAERFPRPDLPERIVALAEAGAARARGNAAPPVAPGLSAPGRIGNSALREVDAPHAGLLETSGPPVEAPLGSLALGLTSETPAMAPARAPVESSSPVTAPGDASPANFLPSPGTVDRAAPRPRIAPLSPARYALQVTVGQATHDRLRHAQALLRHQLPSGDLAEVLDRALVALIEKLERCKIASTNRPRPPRRVAAPDSRRVPAHVRRAVWARDQGRCTFVSDSGRRCEARDFLEFDHVDPVARGGRATVPGIRLRCRAHNQYAAEAVFGSGFMSRKREAARDRATRRATRGAPAPISGPAPDARCACPPG